MTPSPITTPSKPSPQAIAMEIATGNWRAQATRTFITSKIAGIMEELCTEENKFVSVAEIAKAADVHPDATYRLLRFLSTFDVCIESGVEEEDIPKGEDKRKCFKLGLVGEVLTPNHPQSVANAVCWTASPLPSMVWDKLGSFLKTNKKVIKQATGGKDLWKYFAENPPALSLFQRSMTDYSNAEAFFLQNDALSPTFDLSGYDTVCDLGAAEGTLALMLTKRFPNCNFILSDLPECVNRIDESSLPSNFMLEVSDFLAYVPRADAYLLKHIIHDWDDEHAETILRNIYEENPNATVFLIEFGPMPGPNVPHLTKGFDLSMGILQDAKERTQEEYDALYEKSGCKRVNVHQVAARNYPLYVQEIKSNDSEFSS